ncbi:type VII secretion protein EccE [Micromonospora citrea]|uniref:Type VII secretion protein EccE n=1 Tax=Micromonospora citrea TaxID=47855 RepID=A0A1C6URY1_9ACTN|nr:type VII secretion protein EccE [Micromonospora citrea]SCL56736.1 type VII secretion protein EccE [Micromonospora citrea]
MPAPAPTVSRAGAGPRQDVVAQRGQGRATVGTAYVSQAAGTARAATAAQAGTTAQAQAGTTAQAQAAPPPQAAAAPAAPQSAAAAADEAVGAGATRAVRPHQAALGIGGINVAQLVAWQAGAAAVLAASPHGVPLTATVATVAVLLLTPTMIRFRNRWLYQWISVWWGYRGRRRQLTAADRDAAVQLLAQLERGVELETIEVDDQPAVLLTHRGGLSAVFEVDPTEGALLMSAPQALPSPASLLPAADEKAPPVAVQLLIQVTPAPRARSGAVAVDRAYRELTNGDVPASRQAWVVLQAARTPDFHADRDLRPTLTAAIRRTRRQLRQERVTARMLNRDEVLAAVVALTHLTGGAPGAAGEQPLARETWRGWSTQGAPQSCHRMLAWPRRPWEVDPLLRGLPAASVVSIAASRTAGDDVAVEVAFRLMGTDPTALAAADQALHEAIRSYGGRLQRLDGEHAHGVAATLPLGGFLP